MLCLPVNQIIKSFFGSGQKPDESADQEETPAPTPLEIGSPHDFRKETVSLPGLSADEIALLREQAIAATVRTQTPPPRDSYSSRGHGRNGSYASTMNTTHGMPPFNSSIRDSRRNGSVSSHPTIASYSHGHVRNGSLASWGSSGGPPSPQRTRHASVY